MARSLDTSVVRRVLIRATNWLGDAVMTTPAMGAIRRSFPAAHITVLANPLVAEMFSPHPWVDEVLVYDKKGRHAGLRGKMLLAAELRRHRFDLAILLQNAFDAALLAWLAGIPRRMGYRTDGRGLLLTHGVAVTTMAKRLHHVDYYLAMVGAYGITTGDKTLNLAVTSREEESMAGILHAGGIGSSDLVIGINPGATYGSAKRWYPERFAEVADQLARYWGGKVVLTGGAGEADIAGEIEAVMDESCINLAGRTSVRELMALIKRCNLFVTNDSGPMHIAAAFDVPLVAVFGPTDHTTTSPFSERAVVVRRETECAPCLKRECPTDHRCMTAVTVEDLLQPALALRQRNAGHGDSPE